MSRLSSLIIAAALLILAPSAHAVSVTCPAGLGLPCLAAGNDSELTVEAAILAATGVAVDIELYGKSDDNPELFTFVSTNPVGADLEDSFQGTWSVNDGTLISYVTVKAATSFLVFLIDPASSFGIYDTLGILNPGGQQPDVSHLSFWTTTATTEVPEPTSVLLLLSGVAGMAAAKRKRKAA